MNQNTISPDDPRLTAYALNELPAAERAEFEQLLQSDAAARQTVEEIRTASAMFASALDGEAAPAVAPTAAQAAIIPGGDLKKLDGGPLPGAKILRFPQFYYMVSGLAAACFALFFVYWQRNQPVYEKKAYVEVDLAKFKSSDAPADQEQHPVAVALPAASAPQPAVTMGRADEQVIKLEPFEVSGPQTAGYAAATTLSGSRQHTTELRDIGNSVSVVTNQFVKDVSGSATASVNPSQALNIGSLSATADSDHKNASEARARQEAEFRYAGAMAARKMMIAPAAPPAAPEFNTESYRFQKDNDYLRVGDNPLSTFSIDVDTAAYANVRRFLTQGQRPPTDAVRIEEMVNYFPYHYAPPSGPVPFAAHLEVASAPWAPEHRLVRIGLKGREVSDAARPAANLVFLLDVSGSMNSPNKLPLVKQSLRLLVEKLRADDRVAIAVYAGASGLALPSTPASRKADILAAIDRLDAGGSTNGAMGIHLAYDIAKANFVTGGVNRVILATDGDFNVGVTDEGELVRLIEEKAKGGVFLSVLGYGMGNLKDSTLEQLADKGNGNYAYIDSLAEAKKTLVEQAGGTLVTIAKDVKIQVEFNPAQVAAYRLIGYENRLLAKEDFNNDKVDAGEIGAGHTVTALYEVILAGGELPAVAPAVDALKYQQPKQGARSKEQGVASGELLTVKIRYKEPTGDVSSKLEFPLRDTGARFEDASQDFKFAAAVAGFGMVLRDSPHKGALTLADISTWGRAGLGSDAGGYRSEFLGLVQQAEAVLQ